MKFFIFLKLYIFDVLVNFKCLSLEMYGNSNLQTKNQMVFYNSLWFYDVIKTTANEIKKMTHFWGNKQKKNKTKSL